MRSTSQSSTLTISFLETLGKRVSLVFDFSTFFQPSTSWILPLDIKAPSKSTPFILVVILVLHIHLQA